MESIEEINKRLKDNYGRDVALNNPNFRIVKADLQTEHRRGTFRDYTPEGIYLREVTEIREVPKYPYDEGAWILERLQGNLANPELLSNVSYEPIWVFGKAGSHPIPVWRAVELIVKSVLFVDKYKKSPSDITAEEEAQFERERALFKSMLQNESPYLATALKDGYAVTVASDHLQPVVKE